MSLQATVLLNENITHSQQPINRAHEIWGSSKESFLHFDLTNAKTGKFAKALKNDHRKHTLGDMNWVMNLMKSGGNTLSASPVLKDFKEFTLQYFDERITVTVHEPVHCD